MAYSMKSTINSPHLFSFESIIQTHKTRGDETVTTQTAKEQIEEQPIIVWDTCAITQGQAEFLVEQAMENGETLTKEQAFNDACEDGDVISMAWDDETSYLTTIMEDINKEGAWYVEVNNFGWRHLNGFKYFRADDGQDLLHKLLPQTDCTFSIYRRKDEATGQEHLVINNAHHDAPCGGEMYYIYPAVECEKCGDITQKENICAGEYSDVMCKNCYTKECVE